MSGEALGFDASAQRKHDGHLVSTSAMMLMTASAGLILPGGVIWHCSHNGMQVKLVSINVDDQEDHAQNWKERTFSKES